MTSPSVKQAYSLLAERCNVMLNSKFIMSSNCIASILKVIASVPCLTNYLIKCSQDFSFDLAFDQATKTSKFTLPDSAKATVAFVSEMLFKFDRKELDLTKFIKIYYPEKNFEGSYKAFTQDIIAPYLLAFSTIMNEENTDDAKPAGTDAPTGTETQKTEVTPEQLTQQQSQLFDEISSGLDSYNFDDETKAQILNAYTPDFNGKAEEYVIAAKNAIQYGKWNTVPTKNDFYKLLSPAQQKTFFEIGRNIAEQETLAKQAQVERDTTVTVSKSGKVHLPVGFKNLDKARKAQVSVLARLNQNFLHGNIYFYESSKNKNGKRTVLYTVGAMKEGSLAPNGNIHIESRDIYIDLHSGNKGEGLILSTAAHEFVHDMARRAPKEFKALSDYLMKTYNDLDADIEGMVEHQKDLAKEYDQILNDDEAFEEVVARSMERMLADPDVAEKLYELKQTEPKVFERIKAFFEKLYKHIVGLYKNTTNSLELEYLSQAKDQLETLKNLFAEGLYQAGENAQKATGKKSVDNSSANEHNKFSYRDEYTTNVMQWAYSAGTRPGDTKVFKARKGFSLYEATQDGYIELYNGKYQEAKRYEDSYGQRHLPLHGHLEALRSDQGRNIRNYRNDAIKRNDAGSSGRAGGKELQSDESGSNEHSRQGSESSSARNEVNTKFSLRDNVEETKDLIAVHNLSADQLEKSLDLGGLPMPSIAIIKAQNGHSEYGDVSLVFNKDTIDPQLDRRNKVYGGDAWTPTYPTIEYKVNGKIQKKISDKYYSFAKEHGYDDARPLYNYVYDTERQLNIAKSEKKLISDLYDDTKLMQFYRQDVGLDKIEPVQIEHKTTLSDVEVETFDYIINAYGKEKANELREQIKESPSMLGPYIKAHFLEFQDAIRKFYAQFGDFSPEAIDNILDTRTVIKQWRDILRYLNNGKETIITETDYNATEEKIRTETDQTAYRKWIDDLFTGIEEKSGIRNNVDYFDYNGNPRSWERLHYENNLENVVKVMMTDVQKGGKTFFSGLSIWGIAAKDYNSIGEIKADESRLKKIPEEQYSEIKQMFGDRFTEIAKSIVDEKSDNSFIALDLAFEVLIDGLRTKKTKSGLLNYLQTYNKSATTATVDDLIALVQDIAEMPTEYFEAKPQRAVEFNEVAAAIVPDDTDEALIDRLNNSVGEVIKYKSGDEQSRIDALNSVKNVKFSLRDDSYMQAVSSGDTKTAQRMVDEAAKDAGYDKHLYHGSKSGGGFTVFKGWQYFTENEQYAKRYTERSGKGLYNVFVKADRLFDTRRPEDRIIFDQYVREYGLGEIQDSGLPDWTDGYDLSEIIEENDLDYDGIILDEGGDMVDGKPVSRGVSYVIRNSEQVKSAEAVTYDDNGDVIPLSERFNSEKADIRYSPRDNSSSVNDTEMFSRQLNDWLSGGGQKKGSYNGVYFKLGRTSDVLIKNGASDSDLIMLPSVIEKITGGKHSISLDEISKLPEQLNDPILLFKGTVPDSVVALTEITDKQGNDVIAAIHINKQYGRSVVNRIASLYSKSNEYGSNKIVSYINNQINQGNLLYASKNKAPNWFTTRGLQLPNVVQTMLDANTIISNNTDNVNKNSLRDPLFLMESNRSMLLRAFESSSLNSTERDILSNYKEQIDSLDYDQAKLHEIRKEIKEISFTKGSDRSKLPALQNNAKTLENRIAREDKKLLKLESAKPLQDVLSREKAKQKKRMEQKLREHMKELRNEINERDKRQAAKIKLDKLIFDTTRWLTNPAKNEVKCPDILREPYKEFLDCIDTSSQRKSKGGADTKADLRFANAMENLASAIENVQRSQSGLDSTNAFDSGYLDLPEEFVDTLRFEFKKIKDGLMLNNDYSVFEMDSSEIKSLYNMMQTINHAIKNMSTLYSNMRFAHVEDAARQTMQEVDRLKERKQRKGDSIFDFIAFDNLTPFYAFKKFGPASQSMFYEFMDAQDKLAFNSKEIFDFKDKHWTDKQVKQWSNDEHKIKLSNGDSLSFTSAEAMGFYCLTRREAALDHIFTGGNRFEKANISEHLTTDNASKIIAALNSEQIKVA